MASSDANTTNIARESAKLPITSALQLVHTDHCPKRAESEASTNKVDIMPKEDDSGKGWLIVVLYVCSYSGSS